LNKLDFPNLNFNFTPLVTNFATNFQKIIIFLTYRINNVRKNK